MDNSRIKIRNFPSTKLKLESYSILHIIMTWRFLTIHLFCRIFNICYGICPLLPNTNWDIGQVGKRGQFLKWSHAFYRLKIIRLTKVGKLLNLPNYCNLALFECSIPWRTFQALVHVLQYQISYKGDGQKRNIFKKWRQFFIY